MSKRLTSRCIAAVQRKILLICLSTPLLVGTPLASAGEGHDHGDKASTAVVTVRPTITAQSELFEIVGTLQKDELSLLIDRAATNAPVLGAKVEVEFDNQKAVAAFHVDHGDYSLTDAVMLAKLATTGEHALTFTVIAASDSDLLTGTLDNHGVATKETATQARSWTKYAIWGFGLLLTLAVFVIAIRFVLTLRRTRQPRLVEVSK